MYDAPRHRFTLCRAALRSVLCRELACSNEHLAFRTSEHGKPYAIVRGRRAPISFNVSHSGTHGLIALVVRRGFDDPDHPRVQAGRGTRHADHGFSDIPPAPGGQVGIDVEERVPHRNLDELIEAVFGPNERHELSAANNRDRLHLFFRLWTMKEALSKAHGMGLSLDVSRFEIPQDMRAGATGGSVRFADMPGAGWRLEDISTDRFAAAVAFEGSGR